MQRWPPKKEKSLTSHRLFSPTPEEIRRLILDYLCQNSFTDTAKAFVNDSAVRHLDADGDEVMSSVEDHANSDELASTLDGRLDAASRRRDVRVHILSGRVEEAIELLNAHFPSVLADRSEEGETIEQSKDKFNYTPSTSVDPTHLALNLRILSFIEAARTIPLPYRPTGSHVSLPATRSVEPPRRSNNPGDEKDPMDERDLNDQQHELLRCAQSLYVQANALVKPTDRALYLTELSQVSGLLAYTNPEQSIMAPYMSQERREAVADQIEAAILFRTGHSPISTVELYTRYTTVLWAVLRALDTTVPPTSRWPSGVRLPPSSQQPLTSHEKVSETQSSLPAKKSSDKDSTELVPEFSLRDFLSAKS